MKYQKAIFKVGDIVTQKRSGWRRQIFSVEYDAAGWGKNVRMDVVYRYFHEELDGDLHPTGGFDVNRRGICSQDHLRRWLER